MKIFHNKMVGKIIAVILGLSCAVYFGWTFSYFGYWMGTHFQGAFPEAPQTIALAAFIVMFLAVIYSYFYIEYTKEDVQAYEDDKGDGSYIKALNRLKWAVLGVELFSLLFRWFLINFAPIGIAMIGVGVGLLYLAHLFGKVLHAQVNAPYDVEAGRVMHESGTRLWHLTRKTAQKITNADKLRRIADGDLSPIDEYNNEIESDKISTQNNAQRRRRENQEQRNKKRNVVSRFMSPKPDPVYADPDQQNGHQTIRGDGRSIVTHYPPL